MKNEKDKQTAIIWKLAWPAMIEFGLQTIVQYVDLYMVGTLGVDATAVVGLCAQLQFLIKFPINGLSIGVLAVIAQVYGEKRYSKVKKSVMQALYYAIMAGSIFFILSMIFSGFFPDWFRVEASLRQSFLSYFRISYSTIFFFAATSVMSSALRAVGDMKSPMFVNALVNILNIILNYLLIYDTKSIHLFGIKVIIPGANLGLDGAAIGTAISIFVGSLVMFYKLKCNDFTDIKDVDYRIDFGIQKKFISIGVPAALTNIMTGTGRLIFTTYISMMGTIALAAHSIAYTIESLFYIPAIGLERATSTLAGNYLGEKNEKKIKEMVRCGVFLVFGIMLLMGGSLFGTAEFISAFFTKDEGVSYFSGKVLRIISLSEPLFGLSILMQGVLEGMGETKKVLVLSTVSMWFFRVLICYFVTVKVKYGLEAAWICMAGDNICRALLLVFAFIKGEWKSKLD